MNEFERKRERGAEFDGEEKLLPTKKTGEKNRIKDRTK